MMPLWQPAPPAPAQAHASKIGTYSSDPDETSIISATCPLDRHPSSSIHTSPLQALHPNPFLSPFCHPAAASDISFLIPVPPLLATSVQPLTQPLDRHFDHRRHGSELVCSVSRQPRQPRYFIIARKTTPGPLRGVYDDAGGHLTMAFQP